jgi:hypothetical protein
MSDQNAEPTEPAAPTEKDLLMNRAKQMGIKFHPNAGVATLKKKIDAKLAGTPSPEEAIAPKSAGSRKQREARIRKEARRLIRVNIACMNPAKKDYEGEIFAVGNSFTGTIKKYVPFNTEEGWHVPKMLLNMIEERKCQVFTTKKDGRGRKTRVGKLIKEFSIQRLDPLDMKEMKALAATQTAANNLD